MFSCFKLTLRVCLQGASEEQVCQIERTIKKKEKPFGLGCFWQIAI